jgi:LmbE family N-acetylglucosaminyl deacetylase
MAGPGRARALPGVIVLSPHLDDAVLSLGALIARLAAEGRSVEVWTAFTGPASWPGAPRAWRAFGDYPARLAEDDRALDLLGAGRRRLGLPERLWREPRLSSLAQAFRCPPALTDFRCLSALVGVLSAALADPGVELYAPLGVGQHVDHVEVAAAAVLAVHDARAWERARFYEDFYALAESGRRRHSVTRHAPVPLTRLPGWAAPVLGSALRLLTVVSGGPDLGRYLPVVRSLNWQCRAVPVTGFEEAKLDAVARYESQLPRLGGRRRVSAVIRRSHLAHGGEPVWTAQEAAGSPSAG